MNNNFNQIYTYTLWLKFKTSKDLAFSNPSGTSFSLLWDRSNVVNSSKRKSSAGIPELFTLLCLTLRDRRHFSSVSSPNNFSRLFFFRERFSCKIKGPSSWSCIFLDFTMYQVKNIGSNNIHSGQRCRCSEWIIVLFLFSWKVLGQ